MRVAQQFHNELDFKAVSQHSRSVCSIISALPNQTEVLKEPEFCFCLAATYNFELQYKKSSSYLMMFKEACASYRNKEEVDIFLTNPLLEFLAYDCYIDFLIRKDITNAISILKWTQENIPAIKALVVQKKVFVKTSKRQVPTENEEEKVRA
ncbi:MAG: hypothetical protein BGO77_02700 [Caedibacter sp. 37-49]|nr:MAG: hypothetical protein BGO77_02700 [Caedibacter sp. 37-49]